MYCFRRRSDEPRDDDVDARVPELRHDQETHNQGHPAQLKQWSLRLPHFQGQLTSPPPSTQPTDTKMKF